MLRFLISTCLTLTLALPQSRADGPGDGAAAAKTIAPFLDEQAFAVVRIDLKSIDVDDLASKFAKLSQLPNQQVSDARKHVRDIVTQLTGAGVNVVYGVASLADLPMPGPFLVATVTPGGNTAAVAKVFEGLNMEGTLEKNGVVAAGPKTTIARLKTLKPSARTDLSAAFGAVPDATISVVLVPGADQRRVLEEMLPKLPKELGGGPGTILSHGVRWAALGITTKPKLSVNLVVQSPDGQAAQTLRGVIAKGTEFVAQAAKEMQLDLQALPPLLTPKVAGDRLTLHLGEDDEPVAKLLATAAKRTQAAAGRARSMNNLKQFGLALHMYHDSNGHFPMTANLDKNGKPLLSWRVHILPFIEQDNLYKQFKLDEPWDSETNKALIEKMPEIFKSPAQKVGDGKTTYLAPMANNTVIAPNKATKIADITDGTSNTIMLVESNDDAAVIWTKPDDLSTADAEILKKLIGHYDDGFIAGFADGSVRFIRKTIDLPTLKALFTRNGGELIDHNKIP
jgi:hypothetical protein